MTNLQNTNQNHIIFQFDLNPLNIQLIYYYLIQIISDQLFHDNKESRIKNLDLITFLDLNQKLRNDKSKYLNHYVFLNNHQIL